MVTPKDKPGAPQTLAEKLDHLFHTVHARGRGEYTYREVAAAIEAEGGFTISSTYVWQLRKGLRDNPTKMHLEALSKFFGVPPAYFFDDSITSRVNEELTMLAALRDTTVRGIALRSSGLGPQSLAAITGMIDHIRTVEGLPPVPPDERTTGTSKAT